MNFDPMGYVPDRSQIFNKKGSKKNVVEKSHLLADEDDRYLEQFYPSQREAFIVIPTTLFHYQAPITTKNAKNLNTNPETNLKPNQQNRNETPVDGQQKAV